MLASCLTRIGRTPISRAVKTQQFGKSLGLCGTLNSRPAIWETQSKSVGALQPFRQQKGEKIPPPFGKMRAFWAKCVWFGSSILLGALYSSEEVKELKAGIPQHWEEHPSLTLIGFCVFLFGSPLIISAYPDIRVTLMIAGLALAASTYNCICYICATFKTK